MPKIKRDTAIKIVNILGVMVIIGLYAIVLWAQIKEYDISVNDKLIDQIAGRYTHAEYVWDWEIAVKGAEVTHTYHNMESEEFILKVADEDAEYIFSRRVGYDFEVFPLDKESEKGNWDYETIHIRHCNLYRDENRILTDIAVKKDSVEYILEFDFDKSDYIVSEYSKAGKERTMEEKEKMLAAADQVEEKFSEIVLQMHKFQCFKGCLKITIFFAVLIFLWVIMLFPSDSLLQHRQLEELYYIVRTSLVATTALIFGSIFCIGGSVVLGIISAKYVKAYKDKIRKINYFQFKIMLCTGGVLLIILMMLGVYREQIGDTIFLYKIMLFIGYTVFGIGNISWN